MGLFGKSVADREEENGAFSSDIVVTTTDHVEGKKIDTYLDIIHHRANLLNDSNYKIELQKIAAKIGADAVVGVKAAGSDPLITLIGTAVKLQNP